MTILSSEVDPAPGRMIKMLALLLILPQLLILTITRRDCSMSPLPLLQLLLVIQRKRSSTQLDLLLEMTIFRRLYYRSVTLQLLQTLRAGDSSRSRRLASTNRQNQPVEDHFPPKLSDPNFLVRCYLDTIQTKVFVPLYGCRAVCRKPFPAH